MTEREIADLAVNEDFDIYTDARGDLATADGRSHFEQEVMLRVSRRYLDIVGDVDRGTVADLLEVEARRVADEMEELDDVADILVRYPDDEVNTVKVTIIYDTGDELTFTEQG